ncbi:preprotein translocase subunit SecE [Abyssicoccus albus]|mgnify:FL=1|uniref:Protein translocase subunit SecE n=1 Tax=Abyssicoccus albus TaxID=1817405 RepID=A0A1Q1G3B6_9BACL|nr:preprotein translocase subunit SecE [Abyssicoccus albus]AQL56856.1 preprotein translocase subunit SecE [Abyssicoccus albus]RPF54875.1 preprotein translocase subunit SecE [Abyssicoccus albus]
MNNNKNFFANVVTEMKKVSWPTGQETAKYTVIVMLTVIFFLAFFYLVDLGISQIIEFMQ